MSATDLRLPDHRPLITAHRAGNSIACAREANRLGADMIETDIWLRGNRLEIRHMHRLGPILWERWRVGLGWPRLTLRDLLQGTTDDALLFLDLKGDEMELGPAIVGELQCTSPNRPVAVCGRNYPQMDRLLDSPNMVLFYSVGETQEWAAAWPRLEAMERPALSLRRSLATPEVMNRLGKMNATVVCWDVNTPEHLETLRKMGVDGATADSADLIRQVVRARSE